MTNSAKAAANLLKHNLEIMKSVSEGRDRPNLKQQLEECQTLLTIIVKERNDEK